MAINGRKRPDGTQEADFIPVTAWGKTADVVAQYCHKGSKVGVSGRLNSGSYERDGHKVYTLDVIASQVDFLSTAATGNGGGNPPPAPPAFSPQNGFTQVDDDELPF